MLWYKSDDYLGNRVKNVHGYMAQLVEALRDKCRCSLFDSLTDSFEFFLNFFSKFFSFNCFTIYIIAHDFKNYFWTHLYYLGIIVSKMDKAIWLSWKRRCATEVVCSDLSQTILKNFWTQAYKYYKYMDYIQKLP